MYRLRVRIRMYCTDYGSGQIKSVGPDLDTLVRDLSSPSFSLTTALLRRVACISVQ